MKKKTFAVLVALLTFAAGVAIARFTFLAVWSLFRG
jgi:hypothetical protein